MVVVGASGRSAYSDDGGVTWSSSSATSPTQATGSTLVIDQLVWTGAQFVAIQAGAFAATSVSGTSWVNRTTSLRDSGWVSPTYGGGTAQVGTYAAVLANDKYLFFGPEGQAVISPF
jgi:hypothetical protein